MLQRDRTDYHHHGTPATTPYTFSVALVNQDDEADGDNPEIFTKVASLDGGAAPSCDPLWWRYLATAVFCGDVPETCG